MFLPSKAFFFLFPALQTNTRQQTQADFLYYPKHEGDCALSPNLHYKYSSAAALPCSPHSLYSPKRGEKTPSPAPSSATGHLSVKPERLVRERPAANGLTLFPRRQSQWLSTCSRQVIQASRVPQEEMKLTRHQ